MKKSIKKLFNLLGYSIEKTNIEYIRGEDPDLDIVLSISKKDPVIFDVGANKGQSWQSYKKLFPESVIHCFEPDSRAFKILKETIGSDENTHMNKVALSSKCETKTIHLYENSELNSFLELTGENENPFQDEAIYQNDTIECITFDSYCQLHEISHVDLLKIDVQGFESDVIQGSIGALQRGTIAHIFLEMNFASLYQNQSRAGDIMNLLIEHKYRPVGFYNCCRIKHNNEPPKIIDWCNVLYARITD